MFSNTQTTSNSKSCYLYSAQTSKLSNQRFPFVTYFTQIFLFYAFLISSSHLSSFNIIAFWECSFFKNTHFILIHLALRNECSSNIWDQDQPQKYRNTEMCALDFVFLSFHSCHFFYHNFCSWNLGYKLKMAGSS